MPAQGDAGHTLPSLGADDDRGLDRLADDLGRSSGTIANGRLHDTPKPDETYLE